MPFAEGSPIPLPDEDSQPFWDECRNHRLIVRHCEDCGRSHYPPGGVCPWCVSERLTWAEASGQGTVRSFVVFRHAFLPGLADELPYTIVKVELDDHPDCLLHGRLTGPGVESVEVGAKLAVAYEIIGDGYVLPNWTLA